MRRTKAVAKNRALLLNEGGKRFSSAARHARRGVLATLESMKKKNATVRVFLIGNASMRRLNRDFKKKDRATTVLSFMASDAVPYPELRPGERYLGEIYLAPRYIAEKEEDVLRMAVHGCLHLLGYAHAKKSDRMEMERIERSILTRVRARTSSS